MAVPSGWINRDGPSFKQNSSSKPHEGPVDSNVSTARTATANVSARRRRLVRAGRKPSRGGSGGAGVGGLWYGLFPAAAPAAVTAGVTGGVLLGGALLAAFSGVATDPLQRRFGLHQRRLRRLIDGLERALLEQTGRFTVRDHYVARVLDLLDAVSAAYRLTRPG